MSDFSSLDPNEMDATLLDVKEFVNHKLCLRLGWDARMLRAFIEGGFLGGRYFASQRVHKTSERYLYLAVRDRMKMMKQRVEADEQLLDD